MEYNVSVVKRGTDGKEVTGMTNMAIALRLAEIKKEYADTPEDYVPLRAWRLEGALQLDLMKDGVSRQIARNIARGFALRFK